jgi:hypothetical protein
VKKSLVVYFVLMIGFLTSCVSLQDREMTTDDLQLQKLGEVDVNFASFHPLHIQSSSYIKNTAYKKLIDEAKRKYATQYGADVLDIMNIRIKNDSAIESFVPFVAGGAIDNMGFVIGTLFLFTFPSLPFSIVFDLQYLEASGTVVINPNKQQGISRRKNPNENSLEKAIERSAEALVHKLPKGSTVAVLSISSTTNTENLIQELEFRLIEKGRDLIIVDRRRLAQIRLEQAFQMSGDVSDDSAVSVGNMLGATVVITGNITTSGNKNFLRLNALDVQTSQIIVSTREEI